MPRPAAPWLAAAVALIGGCRTVQKPADPPPAVTPLAPEAAAPAAAPPPKLCGVWTRSAAAGTVRFALHFQADKLTVKATCTGLGTPMTVTADAEYAVAKGGSIYGVITRTEADVPDAAAEAEKLAGHTFSARCEAAGGVLTVRDFKFLGSGLPDGGCGFGKLMSLAAGEYKKGTEKDLPPPTADPQKTDAPPAPRGLRTRLAAWLGRRVGSAPEPPAPMSAPPLSPAYPVAPAGVAPPPPPRPTEALAYDGPTPVFIAPAAPPAAPPADPPAPSGPAGPKPVGTWVRQVAGYRVEWAFTDRRVTAVVRFPAFADGTRAEVRAEADYTVGPGDSAAVTVTGVELLTAPPGAEGNAGVHGEAAELVAALTAGRFAFLYRLDGKKLTVREVRPEGWTTREFAARNPLVVAVVLGRYGPEKEGGKAGRHVRAIPRAE